MNLQPSNVQIYHITDVENLPGILAEGGLYSDATMARRNPTVIGFRHIKERRMTQIRIACCGGRFVGEFVPFYFCPRTPMLYTINKGNTGRPPGCQTTILHLVSTVEVGIGLARPWAISDGNAGAMYATFANDLDVLDRLDWDAIKATYWREQMHAKAAEFLVAEVFPWTGFHKVGCHNAEVAQHVRTLLNSQQHRPDVTVHEGWYY